MALDSLARAPAVLAATAVELAGLVAWLGLVRASPALSGTALLGVGALVSGRFLAGLVTDASGGGLPRRLLVGRRLALAAAAAVLWLAWLAVADAIGGLVGVVAASAFLAVALVPQHTAAARLRRREPLLDDGLAGVLDRTAPVVCGFEAAGAAVWLAFVRDGPAVLDVLGVGSPFRDLMAPVASASTASAVVLNSTATIGLAAFAALLLAARALAVRTTLG